MERFIPMVDDTDLRGKLAQAIDGKGAFRRFKDVLMTYSADRERWFAFRSERLRTFMEAWLTAHAITAIARPTWGDGPPSAEEPPPDSLMPLSAPSSSVAAGGVAGAPAAPISTSALGAEGEPPKSQSNKRQRNADALRQSLQELGDSLGPRELDLLVAFAEFLKARRAARGFAHHHEHMLQEREAAAVQSSRGSRLAGGPESVGADKGTPT
jgi:hypothetical protein